MSLARPINQLSNSLSSSLLFSLTSLSFHPPLPLRAQAPGPGPGKPVLRSQLAAEKAPPAHPHNHVLYTPATAPASTLLHLHVHAAAGAACVGVAVSRLSSRVGVPVWWPLPLPCCVPLLPVLHLRCAPLLHSILVALQLRVARSHSRSLPLPG